MEFVFVTSDFDYYFYSSDSHTALAHANVLAERFHVDKWCLFSTGF